MKKILIALIAGLLFSLSAFAAVDLNTASLAELEGVNGIGPKKAQAIIEYRKKNGNFKSVDDLDKVPGFGAKSIAKMKGEVAVGNAKPTTAGKAEKMVKSAPVAPVAKPVVPVPATKPVTPTPVAKPVAPAPAAKDKAKK